MAPKTRTSKQKPPSMYDVARVAGVSQTTVSFVVNNIPNTNIPQETCDRVWSAVKELGWRPNAMARSLRLRSSNTIGLISDEIATSSHAGKIIQGAQDTAWSQNKMLLVINTNNNNELEVAGIEMLLERQVDGIIYATMYHREVIIPSSFNVPIVLLDCFVRDRTLPSVVPDEVHAGFTATTLLLEKGHRRIGFINEIGPLPGRFGRLNGYKQALEAFNLEFDQTLVRSATVTAAEGYRCALELMQLPEPPTALFCYNDSMAMGAYDAVKFCGFVIPDDVAVIGIDNLEIIASQLRPPLTTMELPHYAMGQWAVQYLLDHTEGTTPQPIQHTIACSLIERDSV